MTWNLNALKRSRRDRLLGGICGGLGQCTPLASWVWRALLLLSLLASGGGLVVYLVLWIAVREEGEAGADAQGDRFNPAL